jgi:orotidine-5'-phosphate decarboxylase
MEFTQAIANRPPLVLGIDPRPDLHGTDPLGHIHSYSLELFEALSSRLGAVKFQAAFFEALGPAGFALMHSLIKEARSAAIPVIIDAKRGDIGSTAEAYAKAYLEAYPGSALTVNPYLGSDSLEPFLDAASRFGNTLFVLVKTSNPGSSLFQDLVAGEHTLYEHVAIWLSQQAQNHRVGQWSRVGAVVGATYPEIVSKLRAHMPHSLFLLPGLGAQGAALSHGPGLLNSASRSLYYPGGTPSVAGALEQLAEYLRS